MTVSFSPTFGRMTQRAGLLVGFWGVLLLVGGIVVAVTTPFTEVFIAGVFVPYAVVGLIVVARIEAHHPHPRFGTANVITLTRLLLTCLFGGLAVEMMRADAVLTEWAAWFFFVVASLALVLDGFDGYAARREGLASAFGGRFDMEVDALQILLLSVTAAALHKAGPWVLIGGALRYLYEIAGMLWPPLTRPLPPSWRRKVISVIQGSTLAALLAPIIQPPLSVVAAFLALLLLIYSFAVDVFWLARLNARLQGPSS